MCNPECACSTNPEYHEAYALAMKHAERMGREEGAAQLAAHLKRGRKRSTFGTGARYPFVPSETLQALCALAGTATLTKEKLLAFLHDPAAHSWDVQVRMRNTG